MQKELVAGPGGHIHTTPRHGNITDSGWTPANLLANSLVGNLQLMLDGFKTNVCLSGVRKLLATGIHH